MGRHGAITHHEGMRPLRPRSHRQNFGVLQAISNFGYLSFGVEGMTRVLRRCASAKLEVSGLCVTLAQRTTAVVLPCASLGVSTQTGPSKGCGVTPPVRKGRHACRLPVRRSATRYLRAFGTAEALAGAASPIRGSGFTKPFRGVSPFPNSRGSPPTPRSGEIPTMPTHPT